MMLKKSCCFGHRKVCFEIKEKLDKTILYLIEKKEVSVFYTGGMGEFDMMFSSSVRKAQKLYPNIKLILIKPYFTHDLNLNKAFYNFYYNSIIIPEELAGIHYKRAIEKRNEWMVDHSDFVIGFAYKGYGGAYKAIKYAKQHRKEVINLI